MARPSSSKGSRLTAEERQLEQRRTENLRLQQELEKKLQRLPVQLAEQEEKKRAQAHQRAASAGRAISSHMGRSTPRGRGKNRPLPSRERWAAQRNTLLLLFALAVIFFLLWNVIPSK
jgi:hypothetical protein